MFIFQYGKAECRTLSVEFGTSNSVLGTSLSKTHFASMPIASVPAAIAPLVHYLIGNALAGVLGIRVNNL